MATFARQPQYVGPLDWSSPLAVGLADVLIPSEFRTRVNSEAASSLNAGFSNGAGAAGSARLVTSETANQRDIYSGAWSRASFATGLTLLSVYRLTFIPGANARIAGNFLGGVVSANGYAHAPSTTNFRGILGATTTSLVLTGTAISTALKVDVLEVNSATASLWENGVRTVAPTAATTAVTATGTFGIGSDNDLVGVAARSEQFLHILWRRSLSSAEIASISANPWQLFKAPNKRVLFFVAGAVGGTNPIRASNNIIPLGAFVRASDNPVRVGGIG